ncbi:hypothetical protein SDC9_177408 [bioreactor metagenome]|uniref:Uncharacterized protein n=1 Tax=bioreactor metagenome TaxID=1076179 RepID=A0A645GSX4_9ZZZZ
MPELCPQCGYGGRDAARGVNVVVLEHGAVRQIIPVITASAYRHRVFLERPEAGKRFTGIGNRGFCSLHQFHAAVCRGRNTRHMLNQIESRALAL